MIKARLHSTESFGAVDGSGIRFVIFLHGCNMRCAYCHNPDTWAIKHGFTEATADDLLVQALRYKPYWGKQGGITVSGGEPLLQIDFLIELFKLAKARSINTAIDTSGQPFTNTGAWFAKFKELMKYTDTVLLDLKQIDEAKHVQLTGHTNENIIDMFKFLNKIKKPVWVRYVLVPGWTDSKEDLAVASEFLKKLKNVKRIDVLPYHTLGVHK